MQWTRWVRWKVRDRKPLLKASFLLGPLLVVALAIIIILPLSAASASTQAVTIPSNASCAQLARVDRTATNGSYWGTTILPGFGAAGGWFGVPICANGSNQVAPGGAEVSCDRGPSNFRTSFCAPGSPTNDGYGWSFQCVELVIRFTAWAFGAPTGDWHGDAQYLWLSGDHPASFTPYVNGGLSAPVPGDILVWGGMKNGAPWPESPSGGHVAVVAATGPDWITFVEENLLTARGDVPEETATLSEKNGHWNIGHTYANSGGRAIYGWLHQAGNTGHFSGVRPPSGAPSSASGVSSALPALTNSVYVTGAGALAQLVWSDSHTAQRPGKGGSAAPSAVPESLGAPSNINLSPNQAPAVVDLPGGARYAYVRGMDGALYAAYTPPPTTPGALRAETLWQDLGAPTGLSFTNSPVALWTDKDIVVVALASDHSIWARVGPAGALGAWVSLGKPASDGMQGFQGSPALARAASSTTDKGGASPAREWIAIALGLDGKLYTLNGQAASAATTQAGAVSDSSSATESSWNAVIVSAMTATLTGAPFAYSEPASGALDVVTTDTSGAVWLLRETQQGQPWVAHSSKSVDPSVRLLAANFASDASHVLLYATGQRLNSTAAVPATQATILVGDAPLTGVAISATTTITWNVLGYMPAPTSDSGGKALYQPIALNLGADQRAILASFGTQTQLIGDPAATGLLAPNAVPTTAPGATVTRARSDLAPLPGAGSVALGQVAPAASFADPFSASALDDRWELTSGVSSSVAVAPGALTLIAPSAANSATLTQGAPDGNFSATIHLAPNPAWITSGTAQAGVTLTLDSWNAATLSLRADGSVALCPVVAGEPQACSSVTAPHGAQRGVFLRLGVANGALLAEVSADKQAWMSVGTWKIAWLAGAGAALGVYAPLIAPSGTANPGGYGARPVAFTGLGLFVSGSAASTHGQVPGAASLGASASFSQFSVTAA
jgi:hypothetical protein